MNLETVLNPQCRYEQARRWREEFVNVEDIVMHKRFTDALVNFIWNRAGIEDSE